MFDIADYLKQTNTVLLTKDAFERLKTKASALDKIRTEIKDIALDLQELDGEHESCMVVDLDDALDIIDKYMAEIITNYDFIVGSMECKHKLMETLPEGAKVIQSQYVTSPTMIYAIKKFDIMDYLLTDYQES